MITSGGPAATKATDPDRQRIADLFGVERLDQLTSRKVDEDKRGLGLEGGKVQIPRFIKSFLGENQKFLDQNQMNENFRDTIVANRRAAQRQVRSLNASVFSGRKRRRGASAQIPQVALLGLDALRNPKL